MFLLWCFAFAWMAAKEAAGVAVDGTQAILSLAFPMVIANLALSHGMEWISTQSNFGAGRDDGQ